MSKNYTIENIDGITVTRFCCNPSMDDFVAAYQEVAQLGRCGLRLWDLSEGADVSAEELRELGKIGKQLFSTPSRVAVVAPQDVTFGLARAHEVYRAQDQYVTRTFRTEQEAIAWLKGPA